jgi:hypothetical protein
LGVLRALDEEVLEEGRVARVGFPLRAASGGATGLAECEPAQGRIGGGLTVASMMSPTIGTTPRQVPMMRLVINFEITIAGRSALRHLRTTRQ